MSRARPTPAEDRKSTRLNSSHSQISYAVFCLKKKNREVVKPEIYASLDPAARGSSFQITVVMKIRPGFHVNAREKSEDYLISTDLKSALPSGFSSGEVSYPKGKLEKFAFSKIPLNVYQDTVILRMPITALASVSLGQQHIP